MAYAVITNAAAAGSGSAATTGAIDTTGANLIVIAGTSYDVPITAADSKGNTWSVLTEYDSDVRVRLFYCLDPIVGSGHTFTINSASGFPSVAVIALSGAAAASVFDQINGSATAQAGSVTPSEDNEILIAAVSFTTSNTVSIDGSFTITNQSDYAGGGAIGIGLAYKIQTSAGAENPTWTPSGTFGDRASTIASFKAAAGGGGLGIPIAMRHYLRTMGVG
jgi:hypothetical protein